MTSGSFLTTARLMMDPETNQDHEMEVDMPQQNSESESSMSGVEFDLRTSASTSQQNPADSDKSDEVDGPLERTSEGNPRVQDVDQLQNPTKNPFTCLMSTVAFFKLQMIYFVVYFF